MVDKKAAEKAAAAVNGDAASKKDDAANQEDRQRHSTNPTSLCTDGNEAEAKLAYETVERQLFEFICLVAMSPAWTLDYLAKTAAAKPAKARKSTRKLSMDGGRNDST